MAHARATAEWTDLELVAVARDGDAAAFALLAARYQPRLLRHLAYRTGDPELAADLAQDAFLDAFRRLDRLPRDAPFDAWLYRVAQNRLRMVERRRRLRQVVSLDWLPVPLQASPVLRQEDDAGSCARRTTPGPAASAIWSGGCWPNSAPRRGRRCCCTPARG